MTEDGVQFSIKELLLEVNHRLQVIEDKLDAKADRTYVESLAQRIEGVSTRIPQDLIKEHVQILMQLELEKQHSAWSDRQIADIASWRASAISAKTFIVPALALFVTSLWTVFSIVNAIVIGHPPS